MGHGRSRGLFTPVNLGVAAVIIVCLLVWGVSFLFGDGGFQRMTTLSGIYAVERPSGYNVVCFVERSYGAMQCLPYSEVQKIVTK